MKKGIIAGVAFTLSICGNMFAEGKVVTSIKPNGCDGTVLCPSYPIYGNEKGCCNRNGGHFEVGLLFQQPWVNGTVSGAKSVANVFPNGTTIFSEEQTIEDIDECFNYSAGLTVGMGYLMDHDDWFVKADFDWLSSTISDRVHDDPGTFYYMANSLSPTLNTLSNICFAPNLATGTSLVDLVFNANVNIYALDVALSRGSFHSACYSYEPFVGVKALWYDGNYSSSTGATGSGVSGLYSSFTMKTFFEAWGVGPMFGFNGEYFITHDLSIFSDSDIAILYGAMNFRVNAAGVLISPAPTNVCNNLNAIQNSNQEFFIPIRTILGLKYGTTCMEGKHYVAVKVGYDARYVFARAVTPDIGMSGLYLSLIWDF